MSDLLIGGFGVAGLLIVLALRVPIAVSLGLISFIGIGLVKNFNVAFSAVSNSPFDLVASWSISAIPMFLFMGAIAYHTGISAALFSAARLWLNSVPGGLLMASNWACALFSAASGSSMATAAAIGRLAVPEMLRSGYNPGLAAAVVAASGTLGSLIPPSILFILYGVIAKVPVSKLFLAGILPGLLTAGLYTVLITVICYFKPHLAPRAKEKPQWPERWNSLYKTSPVFLLIGGILFGIYSGFVTAVEAGAVGAGLALVIGCFNGCKKSDIFSSLKETVTVTAQIFFIAIGATLFKQFIVLSGLSVELGHYAEEWAGSPVIAMIVTALVYLILGCFLDPLGILLVTLPVFLPIFEALDMDLIWTGVLVVKYIEISLITPPVGLNVFVVHAQVHDKVPLDQIFKKVSWFFLCEMVIVALLIGFPSISTFLPALIG
ncbi:MAG: C4-dicarboxylate ABC transporter [Sneathiella sp.]|mgnify:CR=1 FL=1|uniref:TRAP transporter large permease n=1 Tax=Sneathiella sp. TaxID=1964365 RepID=UPI000C57DED7|nr:TRAP transporter large permease [Sneathiella sp.]MAZ01780.1 C4-dicarboxylate ABC transporter [Sneathiella sp.]